MFIRNLENYIQFIPVINKPILVDVFKGIAMCITEPIRYKDINIYFLDLTTHTITGTFKDFVGSYIIGYCIQNKIKIFITQSTGNNANSIAHFANKYKIKVIILYPKLSRYKINFANNPDGWATFIELDQSADEIKLLTKDISEYLQIPWLPTMEQQIDANSLRAFFISDFAEAFKISIDYTSQAISAGYGIFGLYRGLSVIEKNKQFNPSLIGVQQQAIQPYKDYIYSEPIVKDTLIEPTLFRTKPTIEMLDEMKQIVALSNGIIESVSFETYERNESEIIKLLQLRNIKITMLGKRAIEKSGIISTIGALQAIERNIIKPNSNILVGITGGNSKNSKDQFIPQHTFDKTATIADIKLIIDKFDKK